MILTDVCGSQTVDEYIIMGRFGARALIEVKI